MKKLFLVMALAVWATGLSYVPVCFAGNEDSGGGDPFLTIAKPADEAMLQSAIALLQEKIASSTYDAEMKHSLLKEMNQLHQAGKYLVLPALVIVNPGDTPPGYNLPVDYSQFLGLGGMTANVIGAPIYFSADRISHYDSNQFAKLLIHEVIHHLVAADVSSNEDFVEELSLSFMSQTYSRSLELAFTDAIFMSRKSISGSGITGRVADAIIKWVVEVEGTGNLDEINELRNEILKKYYSVQDFDVVELAVKISWPYAYMYRSRWREGTFYPLADHGREIGIATIERIARELDPSNPWFAKKRTPGCKNVKRWYNHCDPLLMTDLFDFNRIIQGTQDASLN